MPVCVDVDGRVEGLRTAHDGGPPLATGRARGRRRRGAKQTRTAESCAVREGALLRKATELGKGLPRERSSLTKYELGRQLPAEVRVDSFWAQLNCSCDVRVRQMAASQRAFGMKRGASSPASPDPAHTSWRNGLSSARGGARRDTRASPALLSGGNDSKS